jgi:hypothetical protein
VADHLSIEILGVLRGTAEGPLAVGVLGADRPGRAAGAPVPPPVEPLKTTEFDQQ